MSSEEYLSDEVQEEEIENLGQWNIFNVQSVMEDKSDESTDFMQQESENLKQRNVFNMPTVIEAQSVGSKVFVPTCSQRWEELEFEVPARINKEIPAVTYVLGPSSSSKCKKKLQLADRARIDEELDEQEVLVLRARRKMLEVENEMANKKIKELEMQELTIAKENNSLQREVQLFLKHNQGMNTVIFELQKHNNTLIKRLAELQQERTVFCEKIKDFETIYGDIASKIKLSSKKKLLINKIRKMTKVESVMLIDLTENDVD